MAVTDDLNAAIAAITFQDLNNAPVAAVNIAALQAIVPQLTPSPVVDELNDAISQMAWKAQTNAPVGQPLINQLNDVTSQLLYGTSTTNPPDVDAIGQLTGAILAQEPDWAPLLFLNFLSNILYVQVRGLYATTMTINAVPWWTNWPTFQEAAAQIIGSIYLLAMTPTNLTPAAAAAEDCGCAPAEPSTEEEPQSPAIHREPWRHWDAFEARQNTTRIVPEGCAVVLQANMLVEHSTGRLYAPPPLSADAQAWLDAHRDDLRGGKNWLRRRQQQRAATPQSAPPWTFGGHLLYAIQQYILPQRITYMASFFGVSAVTTTCNVTLAVWPGLQPSDSHFVVQPVMIRQKNADPQGWTLQPTINGQDPVSLGGADHQWSASPSAIHMPQGVWGVIREIGGAGGFYRNGFYRGTANNKIPNLNAPIGAVLDFYWNNLPPNSGFGNVILTGKTAYLEQALVELEIPSPADGSYSCTDLNLTAVFGGLTVKEGPNPLPVNWNQVLQPGAAGGITCAASSGFGDPTTNGKSQVTMAYASS
jgi:hypothetical protein